MAAGRSTEVRTVSVTTTNASTALTAPAGTFHKPEDVGKTIVGTGIPAAATLTAVASATAATLSANATASATVSAVIGAGVRETYGFQGWSPETDAESESYTVAANNAGTVTPDRLADATTQQTSGRRVRT